MTRIMIPVSIKYEATAHIRAWASSVFQGLVAALLMVTLCLGPSTATAQSRIKDLADVEGVRENMLVGYGLVVGLAGTGDRIRNTPFTRESLVSMLERLGVNIRSEFLDTDNIAAVMVTANLPAFSTNGARLDVSVSALGDAESLRGGTLLVTPLYGADNEVYAVAQGAVAVSGFSARGQAATLTEGVPTNGRISNGAVVERELTFELASKDKLRLALRNPDFTTASRMAAAINERFGDNIAVVTDPGTVLLNRHDGGNMVSLLSSVESLSITPDQTARVIIDEASGVVVISEDVRISTVAIAQGSLSISVTETPQVSQPIAAFSDFPGDTVVVPRTEIDTAQQNGELRIVDGSARLSDLVDGLNALGVNPRDMISILQTIKAAGALQADIEVR